MANPVVTSIVASKPNYAPGELITLTVNHTDADRVPMTVTSTVTDSTGNTGTGTLSIMIDGGNVAVTSVPARVWTIVAATANQTVLTATA